MNGRASRNGATPASGTSSGAASGGLGYEPGIDGLRAVSITGVFLFHACATSSLAGWFRGGGLGVSVFFTLSGFLITGLLVRDIDARGTVDLSRFWGRRIRRLAPASLAVIVAVVLIGQTSWLAVHRSSVVAAVWSATNWHAIAAGEGRVLETIVGPLGPTWSLAVEEQFYLALSLLVWLISRTGQPIRNLAVVFAGVIPVGIALANLVGDFGPRLEFGTDVRAPELAVGGLAALAHRRWASRVDHHRLGDVIGFAAIVVIVGLFLTADYTPPWLLRGGFTLVALVTTALVFGVLTHGRLDAALSVRPLVWLGRVSYSLYLVHWPAILVLRAGRVGVDGWALVMIKAAVSVVLAGAVHHLVEQPVRARHGISTKTTVLVWLAASAAVTALGVALGAA